MNWFNRKPNYSVCRVCKVHFEPVTTDIAIIRWPELAELCETHRAEPLARHYRREIVMQWASENWEKLEKRAKKEMDLKLKRKWFLCGTYA